jgi:Undecaprenyl-phosphate galactose phosphotransferase WbaP
MTQIGILNCIADALFSALMLYIIPFADPTFQLRLFVAYMFMQFICGRYKRLVLLATDELKLNVISHIWAYVFGVLIIWSYAKEDVFVLLLYIFICFVFSVWFSIFSRHRFRRIYKHRVLVVGMGESAERFRQTVAKNRFSMFDIRAFIDCNDNMFENIHQRRLVNSNRVYYFDQIDDVLEKQQIDTVIIAITQLNQADIQKIMNKVQDYADHIYFVPRMENIVTFDTKVEDYDGQLLIANSTGSMNLFSQIFKRIIDICFGIAGCILLIPLTVYVKIVNLKNGDKGPIFFTQERIGKDGKYFKIYKYRTMVKGADKILERLMAENQEIREEYTKNKKLSNDPRITKAGKFLREKSLDEFPQFINVLKGEMSVVGPRPYLPREKKDMGDNYKYIVSMKPGLSGMWQTHGRSDVTFEERLILDNYYSHNWNVWLDLTIIYRTISIVLHGRGAV